MKKTELMNNMGRTFHIRQFEHCFNFSAVVILIMVETPQKGLRVDPQIPFAQDLKEKIQGLQFFQQPCQRGL